MIQLFNLTIDGTLQTVSSISVSDEMDRFYNIATFNMDTEPQHELDVVINYGDKTLIYYSAWDGAHNTKTRKSGIGLATIRQNGFVSLDVKNVGNITTNIRNDINRIS